ncbi:MAG: hypothetical protein J3Q66DRAFT_441737 [Benniella sp.]|nr:MAG: hypothetical protein J3Q66DRAFT_441737 [Benniella sp.]
MVSKIVALTLLAALASHVHAYYFHAEIAYQGQGSSATTVQYKIHPVDPQIPSNDLIVREGEMRVDTAQNLDFSEYGYSKIAVTMKQSSPEPELAYLYPGKPAAFMCTKMDEFQNTDTIRKVYSCHHSVYYGVKGIPPPTTTTPAPVPTTTCPAVTVTVPVTVTTTNPLPQTTTMPPKPSPTCAAGFIGKRNGKGTEGACCSHSNDCRDTCVKGICRDRCLTGFEGKKNGKGPNGACCSHSDDCKDTCVWGICRVHPQIYQPIDSTEAPQ